MEAYEITDLEKTKSKKFEFLNLLKAQIEKLEDDDQKLFMRGILWYYENNRNLEFLKNKILNPRDSSDFGVISAAVYAAIFESYDSAIQVFKKYEFLELLKAKIEKIENEEQAIFIEMVRVSLKNDIYTGYLKERLLHMEGCSGFKASCRAVHTAIFVGYKSAIEVLKNGKI